MKTNEMTDLEMHLRSWAPRRPSNTLKQRLFPRVSAPRRPEPHRPLASRLALTWLTASATAAVVLTLLRLPHQSLSPTTAPRPFVAVALSNQAAVATLSAAASNEQFSAAAPSLAVTNLRPVSVIPRSLMTSTN